MSTLLKRCVAMCLVLCLAAVALPSLNVFASTTQPLNVMDFGAAGDGVTGDHSAIQAAIDAAAAGSGGGVVTFPAGTYLADDFIVLKSNVTLQLDDAATIVNAINYSSGPYVMFLTGPYTRGGAKQTWDGVENVTITGGTIDMNGELNEKGTGAKNLSLASSSSAFALGYSRNIRLENVTFLNNYKGHVIQICACDGVTISNCTFKGQSFLSSTSDSTKNKKELIQIGPSSVNGFSYAANDTGAPSQNITIENCYFGASNTCGEPSVAIGTHIQLETAQRCNGIDILNNTFDNMRYAGVRFCGYEDVTIQGNTFIKKTEAESVDYRAEGAVLIDAHCFNNTAAALEQNRQITIDRNVFQITDPVTRAISVTKDNENYHGTVTDIAITNNTIINTAANPADTAVHVQRIRNNLTITGNTITGGYTGIDASYCTGNMTMNSNFLSGLANQAVRLTFCGDNQAVNFLTHGEGAVEVSTADDTYTFTAVPSVGHFFTGYYEQDDLTTLVSTDAIITFPVRQSTEVFRHPLFQACSHTYQFTEIAATCTTEGSRTYTCTTCGHSYVQTLPTSDHSYSGGFCTVCGAEDSSNSVDFYLIGYINGADYGCQDDYTNLGIYKFVDGKLTATFNSDSYVFIKTGDNANWYMSEGYCQETSVTLYNTGVGLKDANKMFVPGGVEITFTLTVNADDTLTLSYETAATEEELFAMYGANMTLGGELAMNFFIDPANLNGTDYYAVINFYTVDGTVTTTIPYAQWKTYGPYLYVTLTGMAAKNMADKVDVAVFNGDGTQASQIWTDSVRGYVVRVLEKQTAEAKTMLVDMLNYGAAAQTMFNYNTGDLANNTLTEAQKAYGSTSATGTDGRVKGTGYYGSNLKLDDQILLTMYFSNITPDMYAIVTFTDHYGKAHETRVEGSEFYALNSSVYGVMVDELVVADGNQLVTVTVYNTDGSVVAYGVDSINSYAARMQGSHELYEMVMKFTNSAYAYFRSLEN